MRSSDEMVLRLMWNGMPVTIKFDRCFYGSISMYLTFAQDSLHFRKLSLSKTFICKLSGFSFAVLGPVSSLVDKHTEAAWEGSSVLLPPHYKLLLLPTSFSSPLLFSSNLRPSCKASKHTRTHPSPLSSIKLGPQASWFHPPQLFLTPLKASSKTSFYLDHHAFLTRANRSSGRA